LIGRLPAQTTAMVSISAIGLVRILLLVTAELGLIYMLLLGSIKE
jgi:hypothetical protein